jgi:hypothetical protein
MALELCKKYFELLNVPHHDVGFQARINTKNFLEEIVPNSMFEIKAAIDAITEAEKS